MELLTGIDFGSIITAIAAISALIFGGLWKMERLKSDSLVVKNSNLEDIALKAKITAKIADNRSMLHREAAKIVMKNAGISEKESEKIAEKIEGAKDGEVITVTT